VCLAMVVCIPFEMGYFKDRFEILKLSLSSLYKNNSQDTDVFVLDNGSCEKVRDYLRDESDSGRITHLIRINQNVGIGNAKNIIFSAIQSPIIAYSDDDVFFHPNWLSQSLKIITEFPNVGMVTGCPTTFSQKNLDATKRFMLSSDVRLTKNSWNENWDKQYMTSLGSMHIGIDCPKPPLITYKGILAFPVCNHFQYLIKKEIAKDLDLSSDNLISDITPALDEKLDSLGYLRLATNDIFVEHLGNVKGSRFEQLKNDLRSSEQSNGKTNCENSGQKERVTLFETMCCKTLNIGFINKGLKFIYCNLSKLFVWKQRNELIRRRRSLNINR